MEFVIRSTLSTLVGFVVIATWLFLGYIGVNLWTALFSKSPVAYHWRTKFAIIGGALTFCIAVLMGFTLGLDALDDETCV